MNDTVVLNTGRGPVTMRLEQPSDADFLYTLFRGHTSDALAAMPVDDAMRESLIRMQFRSQTATYRAQYPAARFDIIERDGVPIGRFITDATEESAYFVDFALLPDQQGGGLGAAITAAMLARYATARRPVHVLVLFSNERCLRMCDHLGFVRVGEGMPYRRLEWRPPAG